MKYLITGFKYIFYIEFYDKLNKSLNDKQKILNHHLNNLNINNRQHQEIADHLMIDYNETIDYYNKIEKEFLFEFNYSFFASLFTNIILLFCIIFICNNYIGINSYLSIAILSLYFYICLLIYRYWVKQTSIYYEQFI